MSKSKPSNKYAQRDYEVGKGKPPEHTKWRQGTSGNPNGKKKGQLNGATIIEMVQTELLERKVTIVTDGCRHQIPAFQAIIYQLKNLALKGDRRAMIYIIALAQEVAKLIADAVPEKVALRKIWWNIIV